MISSSRPTPLPTLACGCYNFNETPSKPDDGHSHCWHTQFDAKRNELRDHCGKCGKWKDMFDA